MDHPVVLTAVAVPIVAVVPIVPLAIVARVTVVPAIAGAQIAAHAIVAERIAVVAAAALNSCSRQAQLQTQLTASVQFDNFSVVLTVRERKHTHRKFRLHPSIGRRTGIK